MAFLDNFKNTFLANHNGTQHDYYANALTVRASAGLVQYLLIGVLSVTTGGGIHISRFMGAGGSTAVRPYL